MELIKNDTTQLHQPQRKWLLEYDYAGVTFNSSIEARDYEEATRLVASHVLVLGEILDEQPA